MPFGLTNVPVYFVDLMSRILRGKVNKFAIVFVDDILVFSKSRRKHESHLRMIFGTMRMHQLKTKFSKFRFWKREVKFLGHIVSKHLISDGSCTSISY